MVICLKINHSRQAQINTKLPEIDVWQEKITIRPVYFIYNLINYPSNPNSFFYGSFS